ncbi:MAG: ATP-binding protein [Halodesulfurarchaeum sp.]
MSLQLAIYVLLFGAAAVATVACIPRARSIQHEGTREGLVGFLAAVGLWSGSYVGYLLVPTRPAKVALYILGFVFAFVAVGAWFYFSVAYTGRPYRDAPFRKFAIGFFLFVIALKLTNPIHHLFFTTAWASEPFPHLVISHQLLYWVLLGLSYAIVAVGFFMLFERFYHTGADSRPLLVLVGLTGLPAGATILSARIEGLLPFMYEPLGVAPFAVGTLYVYSRRFEAIRLTGETDTPAIFLDTDGVVRDYNQAAESLVPELSGAIGEPIDAVSSSLAANLDSRGRITLERDGETRFYEVSPQPFTAGTVQTGRLVTVTDVTERETYRRELEEKTEQLKALNRVVRHDIRNDMMVIIGWSENLREHVSAAGADSLDRVLRKSRHVVQLTEIARDFVDALSEEGTTDLRAISLREVLETELTAVRDSHPDADFQVSGELPDVSVRANEMLTSIFRNLFENAVQHNDTETPTVTLSWEDQGDTIRVEVADDGPGVPDDRTETIFGKDEKGMDSPGTGIGLYLVNKLTEQFGGEVWVEDNQPTGAVFVVELRKAGTED